MWMVLEAGRVAGVDADSVAGVVYLFMPLTFKTSGGFGPVITAFFLLIWANGSQTSWWNPWHNSFLLQRVAVEVQQGNSAAIFVTLSYIICIVLLICWLVIVKMPNVSGV